MKLDAAHSIKRISAKSFPRKNLARTKKSSSEENRLGAFRELVGSAASPFVGGEKPRGELHRRSQKFAVLKQPRVDVQADAGAESQERKHEGRIAAERWRAQQQGERAFRDLHFGAKRR